MPQQVESKVSTSSPGISCKASTAAPTVSNAFWWQWPCSNAVRPGIGASGRSKRPAARSAATNSSNSCAWAASALAAAPGSSAGNSSRRVSRHDGSSPTIGAPARDVGRERVEHAPRLDPRLVDQAGGEEGAAAAQRPAARRVRADATR